MKKTDGRIPFAKDFFAFSKAGRELSKLHIDFDKYDYPDAKIVITHSELPPKDLYKVEKMRLIEEADTLTLRYNDHVKITGIPGSVLDYKVNGRTPIDWIVERFQYKKDLDSGVESDPNNTSSDPQYLLNLLKSIIHVSITTSEILKKLPAIDEQIVSF